MKTKNPLSDDPSRLLEVLLCEDVDGNITRAANVLGVSKSYAMEVLRIHGLNGHARQIRKTRGLPHTGRPPKFQPAQQQT